MAIEGLTGGDIPQWLEDWLLFLGVMSPEEATNEISAVNDTQSPNNNARHTAMIPLSDGSADLNNDPTYNSNSNVSLSDFFSLNNLGKSFTGASDDLSKAWGNNNFNTSDFINAITPGFMGGNTASKPGYSVTPWDQVLSNSTTLSGATRNARNVDAFWSNQNSPIMGKLAGLSALAIPAASLIPGGSLLGLAGGLFNAMGAYQDPSKVEGPSYYDWESGLFGGALNSDTPSGYFYQEGAKNNANFAAELAALDPGSQSPTSLGWALNADLADALSLGLTPDNMAWGTDLFTEEPQNYGQQMSQYGVTNDEAINSLSAQRGNAWNAFAANLESQDPTIGYNQLSDLAQQEAQNMQVEAELAALAASVGSAGVGYAGGGYSTDGGQGGYSGAGDSGYGAGSYDDGGQDSGGYGGLGF